MKKWMVVGAIAAFGVLAVAGSANAGSGLGVVWQGSSIIPDITFPIKMESGMVIEPSVGFSSTSQDDPDTTLAPGSNESSFFEGTELRAGLNVEFPFGEADGASPFLGVGASLRVTSPDGDQLESYTDFGFRGFVGGEAEIADGFTMGMRAGVGVNLLGEQTMTFQELETVLQESRTQISTFVQFFARVWLW